ncbi:MAG: DUF5677 domain-containing protein, partial [Xanthobacteraceae bacterium]
MSADAREKDAGDLLKFVKRLHDASVSLAAKLKFNKSFSKDGGVVCLYGSLIEHASSFITLVEHRQKTGSSSIFRSFLEAYVDFVNLEKDASYIKHCYATFYEQWLKVLRVSAGNQYLKDIAELDGRDAIVQNYKSELQKLEKENFRPLRVDERFRKAGLEAEYNSIYRLESGEAHNSLSALFQRHLSGRS